MLALRRRQRSGQIRKLSSIEWMGPLVSLLIALIADDAVCESLIGALPSSATEATLLAVDCANDGAGEPASLTIQVRDLAPVSAPVVSLQARRNFAAKSTTDGVDGDGTASPLVAVNGGAGRYDVYVGKNAAGEETFEVTAQCWTGPNGTGVATGTSLFATQGGAVPSSSTGGRIALLGALGMTSLAALNARRRRGLKGARTSAIGIVALVAVLGSALAPAARADSQAGSLGTAASATDYYEITCFDDGSGPPVSIEIQIRDASPGAAPFVSVQTHQGLAVRSVSDNLLGDIVPSAEIFLNQGAVRYFVLVNKSGAGAKFYELTYHCSTGPDGAGVHTGTNLVLRQNE